MNNGGITFPKGFFGGGEYVGIKKAKKDLALIYSQVPAVFSGCFTTNIVKAAPVLWDLSVYEKGGKVRGVVVNSGNANACTGELGRKDTEEMARCYAEQLTKWVDQNNKGEAGQNGAEEGSREAIQKEEILICSTGVIGVNLPMDKITKGIADTVQTLSEQGGDLAAEAIMTTDTFMKTVTVELNLSGKRVRIGGMAKGSGMIHPNMATMLAFVTTDANISREILDVALKECVKNTFNQCSVDGDTSTNDTILVLANGLAENPMITEENEDYQQFKTALYEVCKKLAVDVVRDGEGATKLMEVTVMNALTKQDARQISRSVVSSSLFKAALFGEDANCGRVFCAMGYSGGNFDPELVNMNFRSKGGVINLFVKGSPIKFDEALAKKILSEKEIFIDIDLAQGTEKAVAWGCDLSYEYVKINGDYRS